jgi:hypothetical protein
MFNYLNYLHCIIDLYVMFDFILGKTHMGKLEMCRFLTNILNFRKVADFANFVITCSENRRPSKIWVAAEGRRPHVHACFEHGMPKFAKICSFAKIANVKANLLNSNSPISNIPFVFPNFESHKQMMICICFSTKQTYHKCAGWKQHAKPIV